LGRYDVVVKECSSLFELSLRKLFRQALIDLPFSDRMELQDAERAMGKGTKGVSDFGFGELVGLFRQSNLLKKWSQSTGRQLGLLSTLDFAAIVELRNRVTHQGDQCSRLEADLVFNYLMNLLAVLGMSDLDASIKGSFKQVGASAEAADQNKRQFTFHKTRGILINDADGSRNIAFKVETINNIFSSIQRGIEKISDKPTADKMFWEAGYEAGSSFGSLMGQRWDIEKEQMTLMDKVGKWCDFDSDVGWGRLENGLSFDEVNGRLSGTITLSENFQIYKKKKGEPVECRFMAGYIQGVVEQIAGGCSVFVSCEEKSCALNNPLKKLCTFSVSNEEQGVS
jgi:predicted hydrocarbon binding protein